MNRRYISVVGAGASLLVLAGCGANATGATKPAVAVAAPIAVAPTAAPTAAPTPAPTDPPTAPPTAAPTADTTSAYATLVSTDASVESTDLGQLGTDATALDFTATSADCSVLVTDTNSFLSDLGGFGAVPTTFTKTDSLLRQGLGDYVAACTSIIAGINDSDSNELQTGVTELTTANDLITQATAAMGG